jgi:uncharacterized linocin/CFP29 family protein
MIQRKEFHMSTFLKRERAPFVDAAWELIDAEAARILKGNLSARALVDFKGPLGLAAAAVNLGSVKCAGDDEVKGVCWGRREVLPLNEIYAGFALSLEDLDQVARGGVTPDLSAVVDAAQKAALFEEKALYYGLPQGAGQGLLSGSAHTPVVLPKDPPGFLDAVETAVYTLQKEGIGGPYHLVLGAPLYQFLAVGSQQGYPLRKSVAQLLEGGSVRWSPALAGGALVSGRGGDAELTVGQDYAVGFDCAEGDTAKLFLTASFAFRVLEPAAAVELKSKA